MYNYEIQNILVRNGLKLFWYFLIPIKDVFQISFVYVVVVVVYEVITLFAKSVIVIN